VREEVVVRVVDADVAAAGGVVQDRVQAARAWLEAFGDSDAGHAGGGGGGEVKAAPVQAIG
jgi:hypothetical protein